jgi:hypothetical protein
VKENKVLTSVFILAFFTGAINSSFIQLVQANPVIPAHISTPADTSPPAILVFSLQNNSAIASSDVPLVFNVSVIESKNTNGISSVCYKVDWQEGETYVYSQNYSDRNRPVLKEFSCARLLTGIPEGKHNVSIHVIAGGGYYEAGYNYYFYNFGSSLVNFVIDTTVPIVSHLSLENKTYGTSTVPLNFTVNEPASQFSYILDGQEIKINGNTTLADLSDGLHNSTIHARDMAGNIGASETVTFTVAQPKQEPFPTALVATASGASVAIIGAGLLLYMKKRKGKHL